MKEGSEALIQSLTGSWPRSLGVLSGTLELLVDLGPWVFPLFLYDSSFCRKGADCLTYIAAPSKVERDSPFNFKDNMCLAKQFEKSVPVSAL